MNRETIMAIIGVGQFLRADGVWLNLRYVDLRGVDLRGADLWHVDLRDADLLGVDLRDAILRGVDLRGASLWYVDLRGASLRYVDLRGADLRGADLRRANLRGSDLQGVDLWYVDLRRCAGLPWHCFGGSRHSGWMSTPREIMIGCERHTVEHWLAHYAAIGEANGYTPEQIEEYGDWIKSVAERAPVAQEEVS